MKTAKIRQKHPLRLEWIEAGSLADNPHNWRRHPAGQMKALKAALAELDWAGALLYNETTKRLIDGHARKAAVDPQTPVPVLVGRWNEQQELKILATLDPLAAMAETNQEALESLLAEVDLDGDEMEDLTMLLDSLAEDADGGREAPAAGKGPGSASPRKRGERTALFVIGHLKFELPRADFDRWIETLEAKVGNDPDRLVAEIKRRLKL